MYCFMDTNSFKVIGINFGIFHFYAEVLGLHSFLMCTYYGDTYYNIVIL